MTSVLGGGDAPSLRCSSHSVCMYGIIALYPINMCSFCLSKQSAEKPAFVTADRPTASKHQCHVNSIFWVAFSSRVLCGVN